MADLAQILLLPPPVPPPQRIAAREAELAVNAEAQQGGHSGRGRRFRFRVQDGGETSSDIATRRTDSQASLTARGSVVDATARASSGRIRYASADSRSGSSSAFLAQSFAQEQLGEGLHNPPYAAASAAYTRTGAFAARTGGGINISV